MSLLDNLRTHEGIATETDSLGSGGILNTGVYPLTIKFAYMSTSATGAIALNIEAETATNQSIKQAIYMTSGTAKGGKNTYTDKNGKEQYLPGFLLAKSVAMLVANKEIVDLDLEEKTIKLWSYDSKSEEPTKVQMFTELTGKPILAAIERQIVDKNVKNDAGAYVPSGETREQNEIVKFARAEDHFTVAELSAKAVEPSHMADWHEKNKDKVKNKAKGVAAGNAGAPPPPAAKQVTKALFS